MRKQAAAQAPTTGYAAVEHWLNNANLDQLEAQAKQTLKKGKKTDHARAVATLHLVRGLRRNELQPKDLLVSSVPVLPAAFRPVSKVGDTLTPGDANELYRDSLMAIKAYGMNARAFGSPEAADKQLVHDSVRALYGLGNPVNPKSEQRDVKGFIHKICGIGPKFSWVQRKLLSKTVDNVGRAVLGLNPELGLDEVEIPEELAWTTFAPHIQRKLAMSGMAPGDAVRHIKDRTPQAKKALELEMAERPVMYSRAPAWHKWSTVGGYAKIHDGDTININSWVGTGLNGDHDGDECVGQIYACIPDEIFFSGAMAYKNLQLHIVKTDIENPGHTTILVDLEDFPHGDLINTKEGAKGRIDFHRVLPGTKVLAYDEATKSMKWADVSCWSKHYQRELEIVDTHNGYQLVSDDDPRAVYGVAAGEISPRRFTPTAALEARVQIPRSRRAPALDVCTTEIPGQTTGNTERGSSRLIPMRTKIALTADIGWFLGAMAGDGWVIKYREEGADTLTVSGFSFSDADGYNVAKLRSVLPQLFDSAHNAPEANAVARLEQEPGTYGVSTSYRYTRSSVGIWLRGLIGGERDETTSGSANKHLPPFYLSAPLEFRQGLFAGLMDTDGTIAVAQAKSKAKPQLQGAYTSTSIRLVQEIKLLAASIGLSSRIYASKTPLGKPAWQLWFSGMDIKKWGGLYMVNKIKLDKLNSIETVEDSTMTARQDIIPISQELAQALSKAIGCPKLKPEDRAAGGYEVEKKKATQSIYMVLRQSADPKHDKFGAISRQVANRVIEIVGAEKITELGGEEWLKVAADDSVTWERVTGVQKTGIFEDGYDLTVPGYETFTAADGLVLSNTINVHVPATKEAVSSIKDQLMASKMLFANRDFQSVIPAPKHEHLLGLYTPSVTPASQRHVFANHDDAVKAIKSGQVKLHDEVVIGNQVPGGQPAAAPNKVQA